MIRSIELRVLPHLIPVSQPGTLYSLQWQCSSFYEYSLLVVDYERSLKVVTVMWAHKMQVKTAFFGGMAVVLVFFPINYFLAKQIEAASEKMMKHQDSRVKRTGEMLRGMKQVKAAAWESCFVTFVGLSVLFFSIQYQMLNYNNHYWLHKAGLCNFSVSGRSIVHKLLRLHMLSYVLWYCQHWIRAYYGCPIKQTLRITRSGRGRSSLYESASGWILNLSLEEGHTTTQMLMLECGNTVHRVQIAHTQFATIQVMPLA